MNMEAALEDRIEALKSIIEHLQGNGQSRREYYQEKCDIYRHILADLSNKNQQAERKPPH